MAAAGLREPVFETDGFFRTILYRPERAGSESRQTSEQGRPESQPESQPESLEERVLQLLKDGASSKAEISGRLGQKMVSGHLNKIIRSLLVKGLIEYTIPEKPNSRLQKYEITDSGQKMIDGKKFFVKARNGKRK